MEPTPESILAFARQKAQQAWDNKAPPYLLSNLSPDLAKEGIDYKGVLGEQRLKDFLRSAPTQIKVVVHPTQKSKVGLIPPDESYAYETTQVPAESTPVAKPAGSEKGKRSWRVYIVSNFLQMLSELEDSEASQVQIPLPILTKLMREK